MNLSDLRIHIMGIGGAGMSAIARVLHQRGVRVSGDDRVDSPALQALRAEGIPAFVGHDPRHLDGATLGGRVDVLAPSSAVAKDEPELVAARERGLRIWHRGDLLSALLQDSTAIAVAGTHGKSTTTAMIAMILREAGLDPSYIVGATVPSLGVNARHGTGEAFVVEADEYDRTFLRFQPKVAVLTNVEFDHPDIYKDLADTLDTFTQFASSVPADGLVILCADDEGAANVGKRLADIARPGTPGQAPTAAAIIDYGIDRGSWRATNVRSNTLGGMDFSFHGPAANGGEVAGVCSLRLAGDHNVRNALAALVVADACGVPAADAARTLGGFKGAERRFELKGDLRGIKVFDDYGHHPTEIRATLSAARGRFPLAKLWAVWQPHTFSRTLALMDDFAGAFKDSDQVIVLPIYAAREKLEDFGPAGNALNPIEISRKIKHKHARNAAGFGDAIGMLMSQVRGGDVIITFSAGDGNVVGTRLLEMLK